MNTNSTTDKYWKWLIVALAIFNLISLCQYLPDLGQPEPTKAEQELAATIFADSVRTRYERKLQDTLRAQIKTDSARFANFTRNYKPVKDKAATALKTYRNKPTPANCDTAVTALAVQVDSLEYGLAVSIRQHERKDSLIASLDGTIARKDSVNQTLRFGWDAANKDLRKATQPKRWNVSVSAGAGFTPATLQPQPFIGVTIGKTLFRF